MARAKHPIPAVVLSVSVEMLHLRHLAEDHANGKNVESIKPCFDAVFARLVETEPVLKAIKDDDGEITWKKMYYGQGKNLLRQAELESGWQRHDRIMEAHEAFMFRLERAGFEPIRDAMITEHAKSYQRLTAEQAARIAGNWR